jgi:hypothetical protein
MRPILKGFDKNIFIDSAWKQYNSKFTYLLEPLNNWGNVFVIVILTEQLVSTISRLLTLKNVSQVCHNGKTFYTWNIEKFINSVNLLRPAWSPKCFCKVHWQAYSILNGTYIN